MLRRHAARVLVYAAGRRQQGRCVFTRDPTFLGMQQREDDASTLLPVPVVSRMEAAFAAAATAASEAVDCAMNANGSDCGGDDGCDDRSSRGRRWGAAASRASAAAATVNAAPAASPEEPPKDGAVNTAAAPRKSHVCVTLRNITTLSLAALTDYAAQVTGQAASVAAAAARVPVGGGVCRSWRQWSERGCGAGTISCFSRQSAYVHVHVQTKSHH